MKTYVTKAADIERRWVLVDAAGQTLGRLATQIATTLTGKNKPIFSRNLDVGDFVVVINAEKVNLTGKKLTQKFYYAHSGYPSGLRTEMLRDVLEKHPTRILEHAVRGMLPRNRLGTAMMSKLKVYSGPEHPHAAQQPVAYAPK